jgi:aminoglycoside phosphotransferase (APT) family kinase protein
MKSSAYDVNTQVLGTYLEQYVSGFYGPVSLQKFSAGQSNPTFLLSAGSGQYVLRCQPWGTLLKSAHAVDREYRVQQALADTDVPVASVFHLCEDTSVIGVKFYLMSYESGEIFWDPALPQIPIENRMAYYDEAIRILAALHRQNVAAINLSDYGKPGNYFARQIDVWTRQYRAAETRVIEPMDALMMWLGQNCPSDDGCVTLVHGDFRFDNIVFELNKPVGLAVLDWELSTLGHPFADVAYFCMGLRIPTSDVSFGLGEQDRSALGVPDETYIVERYCQLRGIAPIERWDFYIALSFFRLASIIQGVYKRSLDGNASNERAGLMGAMVEQLATMAMASIAEESIR